MRHLTSILSAVLFFTSFIFTQTISWEQLSGPHGGSIYSMVVDGNGNLYATPTGTSGPFKSMDNGESWFSIKNGLSFDESGFRPLNINSEGILFVSNSHDYGEHISLSSDGGSTWVEKTANTNGGSIICIAFDDTDNVYLGTGQGIYRSTDNGDTWALFGNFTGQAEAIVFNDSGYIFAGTSYCVNRSTDGGSTWTSLPSGGGTRTVAIAPNGYLFTGCWENAGILRSTDNGDNWTYVYPQTVSIYSASIPFFDNNGYIYFPTWGKGVLKSTDDGDTWIEVNNNLGTPYARCVVRDPDGNFFASENYGIFKSTDNCENWYSVGLPVCGVAKILIPRDSIIYTMEYGMNRSTDFGQSWQTRNNGLGNLSLTTLTVNSRGYLFAGTVDNYNGLIYRSVNEGENWTRVDSFSSGNSMRGLAVGPNDEIVAVGGGSEYITHISYDDGLTWTDISYNLTQVIGDYRGAGAAAINSEGDIFIIVGTQVWRKTANDTVWTVCTGSGCGSYYVLFIADNGYIYTEYTKSTDNGETWTTNNFPTFITSYAENSQGHLFIGTSNWGNGVFRSTDYAETWEQINDNLPIMDIHSVGVDKDDYLYAGSWGMSMFKTTTSTLTGVEDSRSAPLNFTLEQNYPNPFNPSTIITWESPSSGWQSLKVFDILGREVAVLVNEERNAGKYTLKFNGTRLTSGVYIYQLRVNNVILSRKMLLLK